MASRGRTVPAVVAATVAVLLWQLAAEVRYQALLNSVSTGPGSIMIVLPTGSLFSLQMLGRDVGASILAGAVVTDVVLFLLVLVLVRTVVAHPTGRRWVTFLASWMAVVLAAIVATAVVLPFYLAYLRIPADMSDMVVNQLTNTVFGSVYSGLAIGLLPALVAAMLAGPDTATVRVSSPSGQVGTPPGQPGYPTSPQPGGYGAGDPHRSPYATDADPSGR